MFKAITSGAITAAAKKFLYGDGLSDVGRQALNAPGLASNRLPYKASKNEALDLTDKELWEYRMPYEEMEKARKNHQFDDDMPTSQGDIQPIPFHMKDEAFRPDASFPLGQNTVLRPHEKRAIDHYIQGSNRQITGSFLDKKAHEKSKLLGKIFLSALNGMDDKEGTFVHQTNKDSWQYGEILKAINSGKNEFISQIPLSVSDYKDRRRRVDQHLKHGAVVLEIDAKTAKDLSDVNNLYEHEREAIIRPQAYFRIDEFKRNSANDVNYVRLSELISS